MPCSSPSFFAASSKRASAFWYTFISSGAVPGDIPTLLCRRKSTAPLRRLHNQTQLRLQLFLRLAYDTKISRLPARWIVTRPGGQYTSPFCLPASRDVAGAFQKRQALRSEAPPLSGIPDSSSLPRSANRNSLVPAIFLVASNRRSRIDLLRGEHKWQR